MKVRLLIILFILLILSGCSQTAYTADAKIDSMMHLDEIPIHKIDLQNNLNKLAADDEKVVLPQYQQLYKSNNDMIGFIYLDNDHKYPIVMREDDQNYYLHKDFFGRDDENGCIFANVNSSFDESGITLLYGHNMKSGEMFGGLKNYLVEGYFNEHRYIQIDSLYSQNTYEVVAVALTSLNEDFKYYDYVGSISESDLESYKRGLEGYLIYGSIESLSRDDKIIELSTCAYHKQDGRLVLVLKL